MRAVALTENLGTQTGSYFDHIIPPHENVPAPDAPCNSLNEGFPMKFDFRRLGGRSTALLAGGLVPNRVFQEPQRGPEPTSQFDLASIASTVHRLFNLSTPLTRRTMWSAPFDELLLDEPRPEAEMPMHLPDAPAPATPWEPPKADVQEGDGGKDGRRRLGTRPGPRHCGSTEQKCRDADTLTVKQERLITRLAQMTHTDPPAGVEQLRPDQAERWLAEHWEMWREQGHPTI